MTNFKVCILKMTVIGLLGSLMACSLASDGNSITQEGNCTQRFVDSYNSVISLILDFKQSYNSSYSNEQAKFSKLHKVNSACESFFSNHGGITCKALVNFESKYVSGTDFKKDCDLAKSIVTQSSLPDSERKTENKTETSDSGLKPEQVKFVVMDSVKLSEVVNTAAKDKDPKVIINGRVTNASLASSELAAGKIFCMVGSDSRTSWAIQNTVGREWKVTEINEGTKDRLQMIVFKIDDGTLSMVCAKINKTDFRVSELKEALNGILDMNVSE